MKNSPLHILLAEDKENDRHIFEDAIYAVQMPTKLTTVNDCLELMEYLHKSDEELPSIVFLDLNIPESIGCLKEIRRDAKLKDLSVAIYSDTVAEDVIEDSFIQGVNIYMKKPSETNTLAKILAEVITINWQYLTSDFNKENFIMNIGSAY